MTDDAPVPEAPLDTAQRLLEIVQGTDEFFRWPAGHSYVHGDMYCAKCGDLRRMRVFPLFSVALLGKWQASKSFLSPDELLPCIMVFRCVQCDSNYTVTLANGIEGPDLAIIPSVSGGLSTPHTPTGVAFYLDQAHRAECIGGHSAAVAMFRGALEHLLFEQGFKTGMLGAKLAALEDQLNKGTAPKWAKELDTEFLTVLKDLGNASIHPNDGDVSKQSVLDKDLLLRVKQTFLLLLFIVYEAPHKKATVLGALKAKASVIKR